MTAIHLQPCRDCPATLRRRAALDALSDAAHSVFAALRLWHQRHRERAQLAALDDRMLRDIGISRADAFRISDKPFWRE